MGDTGAPREQQRIDGSGPKVTILTPTYNKPKHLAECAESIFNQPFQSWHWNLVLDNPIPEVKDSLADICLLIQDTPIEPKVTIHIITETKPFDRFAFHRPAWIVNTFYPQFTSPYLYFLADDDLLHPDGLGSLVTALDMNPTWDIVYGNCEVCNEQPDNTYLKMSECFAGRDVGLGTGISPDCLLDGGQILQTKRSWDSLGSWRLPTDMLGAAHNDGIYLNKLAELHTFHYIPTPLLIHRRTHLSTYHRQGL